MEISGKVIAILPVKSGTSQKGTEWKSQDVVIEIPGQYPKRVCVNIWGDKIDTFAIKEGEELNVSIDIDANEYQGKWYNRISAWKVERAGTVKQQAPSPVPPAIDSNDDIPF